MLHQIIILQMALWRVLDIYKRGAKLRGQAPAKTTHFNSDKKVNSKPSGSGRSPLNRFANRPVKPQSAFFEFCSFLVSDFFSFRIVSDGVFFTSFFFCRFFFLNPFRKCFCLIMVENPEQYFSIQNTLFVFNSH